MLVMMMLMMCMPYPLLLLVVVAAVVSWLISLLLPHFSQRLGLQMAIRLYSDSIEGIIVFFKFRKAMRGKSSK